MVQLDQKVFFTSLGFLAVLITETPQDKQASRATALAGLIESFCMSVVPEAFVGNNPETSFDIRQRMAYGIASITKVHHECHPHDLNQHDFTPEEIALHWPSAHALAAMSINITSKDS